MARSIASVRACVLFALIVPFFGCAAPVGSGPGPVTGHGGDSATVSREDAALGTAKKVDHFLSATPLLGKLGPEVADQYRKAMEKQKEVAGLHALVASEQAGVERTSSGDEKAKSAHRLADLKKMAEAGEKSENQLEQRLVVTAKDRSRRAAPRVRATLGPFLTNLRRSVADATAEATSSGELLSLEATVLDALLDGFTKAGWSPEGDARVGRGPERPERPEPSHGPRHTVGHRSRGTDQVVASARGDQAAKATSSDGSREVFAP
jgi:hypothetical protein